MAAGLLVGLGERGTDTVFRRSFSALVARRVHRPRQRGRPRAAGRRSSSGATGSPTWFLRERDLRGYVPGKGWAHAVAHGADAIGSLAESPHLGPNELTVLLDVIADRLTLPAGRGCSPTASRTGWPWPR